MYRHLDAQDRNPEESFYLNWKIIKLLLSVGKWGMSEVLRVDLSTLVRENKIADMQWNMK